MWHNTQANAILKNVLLKLFVSSEQFLLIQFCLPLSDNAGNCKFPRHIYSSQKLHVWHKWHSNQEKLNPRRWYSNSKVFHNSHYVDPVTTGHSFNYSNLQLYTCANSANIVSKCHWDIVL